MVHSNHKKAKWFIAIDKKISNHLPQIIKNLRKVISNRFLKKSCNEDVFNESKGEMRMY